MITDQPGSPGKTAAQAEAYRLAWLREMWSACPESHQTKDERLDAEARNDLLRPHRPGRAA
jgi:hypothetical protein